MKPAWYQAQTNRRVNRIRHHAAKWIEGIENGSNPEAFATWKDRSVRTGCSLDLLRQHSADERAKQQSETPRLLGIVAVPMRIGSAKDWEAMALAPPEQIIEAIVAEDPKDDK